MRSEAELLEAALSKLRRGAPYSVAAIYVKKVEPGDVECVRWRTFVTDGESAGFVDAEPAEAVDNRAREEIPATLIERKVEYAAGRLSRDSRLEQLLASSPVEITL